MAEAGKNTLVTLGNPRFLQVEIPLPIDAGAPARLDDCRGFCFLDDHRPSESPAGPETGAIKDPGASWLSSEPNKPMGGFGFPNGNLSLFKRPRARLRSRQGRPEPEMDDLNAFSGSGEAVRLGVLFVKIPLDGTDPPG